MVWAGLVNVKSVIGILVPGGERFRPNHQGYSKRNWRATVYGTRIDSGCVKKRSNVVGLWR